MYPIHGEVSLIDLFRLMQLGVVLLHLRLCRFDSVSVMECYFVHSLLCAGRQVFKHLLLYSLSFHMQHFVRLLSSVAFCIGLSDPVKQSFDLVSMLNIFIIKLLLYLTCLFDTRSLRLDVCQRRL